MAIATSTALAIAAGAALVGSGVSAYSAIQQGQTAKAMGRYNQKVAENEAIVRDQEARAAIQRQRNENRRLMAIQRGKIAKSGVAEAGSPLEAMAETAGLLELGALEQSRAAEAEMRRLRSQGQAARWQGDLAGRAGYIQAGGNLLSGVASAAGYMGQR